MTLVIAPPPELPEVDLGTTYDAIVVGSGAAGGMAAHVLTSKGLKGLMLEAGKKLLSYSPSPASKRSCARILFRKDAR